MKNINTLVALALGTAFVWWGLVFEVGPKLFHFGKKLSRNRGAVETIKEMLSHSAFFGSAIGAFLGAGYVVAVLWFVGMLALALALSHYADALEEEEKANEFEKTYKAVLDALVSYNEAKAELVEKSKSSDMEI